MSKINERRCRLNNWLLKYGIIKVVNIVGEDLNREVMNLDGVGLIFAPSKFEEKKKKEEDEDGARKMKKKLRRCEKKKKDDVSFFLFHFNINFYYVFRLKQGHE